MRRALSAWCFLIGKAPHLGAMWGVIALGVGWGMFIAVAVGAIGLVALAVLVDTGLRLSRHEVYDKKNELSKSVETAMLGEDIDHTARAADRRNVSANANLKLPDDVQVMGTDAQLVQIGLKAGEELSAEPGSISTCPRTCAPSRRCRAGSTRASSACSRASRSS